MLTISVLYPKTATSRFDHSYYGDIHTPLVKSRFTPTGLERFDVLHGISAPDGAPPAYEVIALLTFTSAEHLSHSLDLHGAEVMGDIANFTDVQPIIQVNKPII